jgi:endonuclease-3 related protein
MSQLLKNIHQRLADAYGLQYWWPAEEPFEVMVGAILTQSAAWRNVEKAIANLKAAGALSPQAIRRLPVSELAQIIRPCGYYNVKALKLKALVEWLRNQCSDDLNRLFASDTDSLRKQLLSIHGIGPETADSILLYAAGKPAFVIDAYTRRIIDRIGLAPEGNSYDSYQRLFMDNLAADVGFFNEYHALLVKLAKDACRKKPLCRRCCLNDICRFYKNAADFNSSIKDNYD